MAMKGARRKVIYGKCKIPKLIKRDGGSLGTDSPQQTGMFAKFTWFMAFVFVCVFYVLVYLCRP